MYISLFLYPQSEIQCIITFCLNFDVGVDVKAVGLKILGGL